MRVCVCVCMCVCVCVCVCVRERERASQNIEYGRVLDATTKCSIQIKQWILHDLEGNPYLNQQSLNSGPAESGKSYTDSFQTLILD